MLNRRQRSRLLLRSPLQQQPHIRPAKIWRNMHLANRRRPHPRIRQLIIDEFVQLLPKPFRHTFIAMRVHNSGYTAAIHLQRVRAQKVDTLYQKWYSSK